MTTDTATTNHDHDPALELAERLDDWLPPHTPTLPASLPGANEPYAAEIRSAVRVARGPHPAINPATRAAIRAHIEDQARVLAYTGPLAALNRARFVTRGMCSRWLAAASVMLVAAALVVTIWASGGFAGNTHTTTHVERPVAQDVSGGGDTVLLIAQDAVVRAPAAGDTVIILAQ